MDKQVQLDELYNEEFYQSGLESYKSAQETLKVLKGLLPYLDQHATSIIDVGCGIGTWLKAWQECYEGIEIFGIDGNSVNPKAFFIDYTHYKQVDLTADSHEIVHQVIASAKNVIHNNASMTNTGGGGQTL